MGIDEVEDALDEAVQTAQDYSVVVTDPDPDATDPEEWRLFFERFGRVRNVTITKKNRSLCKLLLRKHLLLRGIDRRYHDIVKNEKDYSTVVKNVGARLDSTGSSALVNEQKSCCLHLMQTIGFARDFQYHLQQLCAVNCLIDEASQVEYEACRVFISFETEKEQRSCLSECATSYMESMFDISNPSTTRTKFRDSSVLSISESAEPNNIQWLNLESSLFENLFRRSMCWLFSLGIIAALFFAIGVVLKSNPSMVSVLISAINISLPAIFMKVTEFEAHIDEDDRQNSLLFKLYGAKLLTSVIFLYISTSWDSFLNSDAITAIINVQVAACFSAPMFKLVDPFGILNRRILGPLFSTSQSQLNKYWEGSAFMLADRYTEISKVIFISFFYSLLTPVAMFVAVLSCIFMFAVDRYLLFRVTKTPPMLDATMAKSLRGHSLFAIGVKVWLSCRFVYGWPMDDSYKISENNYVKVDKRPSLAMWNMQEQPWHSSSQRKLFIVYKWISIVLVATVLLIIVIWPLLDFLKDFFYSSHEEEESVTNNKEYSRVTSIVAYCPVMKHKTESFIVADTSKMISRHTPEVISCFPEEETNLGMLVKEEDRPKVLARVVWYGDPDVVADVEANNNILEDGQAIDTRGILSTAFARRFGAKKKSENNNLASNYSLIERAIKNKMNISVENDLADVAHIEMMVPTKVGDDEKKADMEGDNSATGVVENMLGMSRIKKSILQRKRSNKIDVEPKAGIEKEKDNHDQGENKHTFMRDEVYLLRQMRKEMLGINIIQSKDPQSNLIDFNKFLYLVQKNAPSAILNPKRPRSVTNLRESSETQNQNIKLSRTLLRRIFVKFIPLQKSLGSSFDESENLVDWPIFVSFVQSGAAVELAALS